MISSVQRSRSKVVVVFLVLTLIAVMVLTYQGVDAARSHRETAERVLRDYALAAAQELAARASGDLEYYGYYPVFNALRRYQASDVGSPLPAAEELSIEASQQEQRALALVEYFFVYDFRDKAFSTSATGGVHTLPPWLVDTLPRHAQTVFQDAWRSALLTTPAPRPRIFVYGVARDTEEQPMVARGFELNLASMRQLLHISAAREPLLPRTLLRNLEPDSVLSARVVDGGGQVIFQSGTYAAVAADPHAHTFTASAGLEPRYGGLAVDVILRPEAANQLIIGGLPRSRLPLLVGLLLLTMGLVLAALQQLRREYELTRLRTEFVSNVSHELRTPLAQIRMFAETLLLGRIRSVEEERRSVEIIDQEARRLTHLVENVLQFSRSERQTTRLAPERSDMGELVIDIVEAFAPLAGARGVHVTAQVPTGAFVDVDRAAFEQMLVNLLDNAVKYGPDNQRVIVGMQTVNGVVQILVDDEGPGVPQAHRDHVWSRFWRHDRVGTLGIAGTGIGLSVVKELASLHDGRVWVEDAPTGGARFVIELPRNNEYERGGSP